MISMIILLIIILCYVYCRDVFYLGGRRLNLIDGNPSKELQHGAIGNGQCYFLCFIKI